MSEKREKFYTVSARLVFSSIIVILIVILALGLSIVINKGPIIPLLGVIGPSISTSIPNTYTITAITGGSTPIIVEATCSPLNYTFGCRNPYFNYTTGIYTVALSQNTGHDWILVTVQFASANTVYSHGVPELSWAPPAAVNVTGGLLSNTTKYINIPIASGPVAVGTNITGTIVAKYQWGAGEPQFYANMSSAVIVVKRLS